MPERSQPSVARADRILDAAAELLVRLGARKVTIEDIAQQAAIGKGTVYLHWRTKQQLFEALLLREAVAYVEGLLTELRRDPAQVQPHRLLTASFLLVSQSPVLRTLLSGDVQQLRGGLAGSSIRSLELLATERFYALLLRHGLLRSDVPNLPYVLSAIHSGFYLLDTVDPAATRMAPQVKAAALAHVVRHACEPPAPPTPQVLAAAAADVIAVFAALLPPYRAFIYGDDPAPENL